MADPLIRPASPEDTPALAGIHVRGWQAAYRGHIDDAYLDALSPEARLAEWADLFEAPGPEDRLWVAERSCAVTGFTYTHPSPEKGLSQPGELHLIYVEPSLRGGGVGLLLFEHSVGDLRTRGYSPFLYTFCFNAAARRFYEGRSWRHDGVTRPYTRPGFPDECRYVPPDLTT